MQRIEVLEVQSSPTSREKKGLGEMVKQAVNAWLDQNPGALNPRVSVSPNWSTSYASAMVLIQYEAPEKAPAKPSK